MANWASPLDIDRFKERVKRYADCVTLSQEPLQENAQSPAQFRPVPNPAYDPTLDRPLYGRSYDRKPSVVEQPSPTHILKKLDLQNLPVELYSEIARYVRPIDLLQLSRTSKTLRGILLHKGNRHIWRTSLFAVPLLPPCPKDMSEPKYTALLFDAHCWACGRDYRCCGDYFLRLRLCYWCYEENVISGAEVKALQDLPEAVRNVVTMSLPCQMHKETFHDTDVSPLSHLLDDWFFKPELYGMIEKLSSPSMTPKTTERYLLEQAKYVRRRHIDAVELYKWEAQVFKFRQSNGLHLARDHIWSPLRDGNGFCQSLQPASQPVSVESTQLWLVPLLNAKERHRLESDDEWHNFWVRDARSSRLKRRKSLLVDWAERLFANHPRFKEDILDLLPTRAQVGDWLHRYANKDDARGSLDAIINSESPEDTEEATEALDSLHCLVVHYYYFSTAAATLQVHRRMTDDTRRIHFHEVEKVAALRFDQFAPILNHPTALFDCIECQPESFAPRPWYEAHAHFRKEHSNLWIVNDADYPRLLMPIVQGEGAALAAEIFTFTGLGNEETIYSLSHLVASGQLTCECGTLRASDESPLDWPTFVHHIYKHVTPDSRERPRLVQSESSEAPGPQADVETDWRMLVKMIPEAPTATPDQESSDE